MPRTTPIAIGSLEEAKLELDVICETFVKDGIVVLRGINLNDSDQLKLTRLIGDKLSWVPNNSSSFTQRYQENHASNEDKTKISGDEIALLWHMEHVEYDSNFPIIAGIWNMYLFKTDKNNGKTYFFDSAKAYSRMPKEWKNFLETCVSKWSKVDGSGPYFTKCVQPHWITGEPVLRIDVTDNTNSTAGLLHTVYDRAPTPEEDDLYLQIRNYFIEDIKNNESDRIVHLWEQGDIVIPDLFKMVHAVTGGFESKDREFIGYWAYPGDPGGSNG
jgi:alpha-ketoglutarate-dependent taurine dioxygenase